MTQDSEAQGDAVSQGERGHSAQETAGRVAASGAPAQSDDQQETQHEEEMVWTQEDVLHPYAEILTDRDAAILPRCGHHQLRRVTGYHRRMDRPLEGSQVHQDLAAARWEVGEGEYPPFEPPIPASNLKTHHRPCGLLSHHGRREALAALGQHRKRARLPGIRKAQGHPIASRLPLGYVQVRRADGVGVGLGGDQDEQDCEECCP